MTRTPVVSDIFVNNKMGKDSDTIKFSKMKPGEIVRIYDDNTVILTGTVANNSTELTLPISTLNSKGGYFYISYQAPDKAESLLVAIDYPTESSGGGDGGGGGGGFFGGVPSEKLSTEESTTKDENGRNKLLVKVKNLKEFVTANASKNVIPIEIQSSSTQNDSYEVQIMGKDLVEAEELKGKIIEFTSPQGTLQVDFKEVLPYITNQSTLKVIIGKVSEGISSEIGKKATEMGMTILNNGIEFQIVSEAGNEKKEIKTTSSFLAHQIKLDNSKENLELNQLAGVMFDPFSHELVPVPSKFEKKENQLTGTMWRKGNSIYAIVKKTINFTDLPAEKEKQTSIKQMASQLIVNGYEDGTFKPDQSVTRAEFAALLVRTLGIVSADTTKTQFTDVKADDWYHKFIAAASEARLIDGYEDQTFRPQKTISYLEMIVMLSNALQYANEISSLSGEEQQSAINTLNVKEAAPEWASESLAFLSKKGIITSNDEIIHSLNISTTRADSAVYLNRLLNSFSFMK